MSNQIVISSGAKVRELEGVLTGTAGVVNALGINVPSGIPQLDGSGKILVSQLPNSVMEYKGTWNAATNTPTLVNGTGNQGDVYLCNVAGTVDFGAGPIAFFVGDQVIYSGTIWQRASGATGTVTSVAVTESGDALTITGSPITTSGTINIGFAGISGQYVNGAGGLTTFPTLLSSVGLSMPSAFSVANSPLTANGTIAVTGAGVASQYIRGDGTLANFPTSGGGGGSVSYYLNGSINQGTFVGNTYYEMSKVPVIGAGTDFTINANGYISQFITDANDPALLEIPAGNWNFEMFFSASSSGGTPSYYVELYKYNGTTFTLIASNSATPEGITGGTAIDLYTTALAVPNTALTLTDRLAVRVYVTHSGRVITLHTENSHLCQVVTTFSTGITALNGLTAQVQFFGTGTSGTDFNISSTTATHTFNLPVASAANTGKLSSTDWSVFNNKQTALSGTGFVKIVGTTISYDNSTYYLASNPSSFIALTSLSAGAGISYNNTTGVIASTITQYTDALARAAISLTTTGTSGAATYNSTTGVFNIPQYQAVLINPVTGTGTNNFIPKFTSTGSTIGNSVIQESSSNIGIGVAPTITAGVTELALGSSNTNPRFSGIRDGIDAFYLYSDSGGSQLFERRNLSLRLGTNNDTRLTISSAGASEFSGFLSVLSSLYDSGAEGLKLGFSSNYYNAISATFSSTAANNKMNFVVSSGLGTRAIAMTLQGNGNVGIGISNNTSKFEIQNVPANDWGLSIWGNTTTGQSYGGIIRGGTNGSDVAFRVNNAANSTTYFTIIGNGNTLINTTTDAGYKLDVNGTGRFAGALSGTSATFSGNMAIGGTTITDANMLNVIGNQSSVNIGVVLNNTNSTHARIYALQNVNGNFNIRDYTAGVDRLTIASTGAATFSSRVNVNGAPDDADIAMVVKAPSGSGKFIMFGRDSSNVAVCAISSAGAASFTSGVINGTVSGGGTLQVNGNVNINGVFQINGVTIGGGGGSGVTGSGTNNYLTKWTGSTTLGNGSITDNGSTVSVLGGVTLQINRTDNARGLQLYTTNDECVINSWEASSEPLHIRSNGGGGRIQFFTAASERMRITSSGLVGIGTNAPNATLDVQSSSGVGSSTASGLARFITAGTTTAISIGQSNSTRRLNIFSYLISVAGEDLVLQTEGANVLVLSTNSTERVRVSSGGNLLVGTTSDNGFKLQINGSASFAFGFLSVYRGSTGANDILVGNDGNRFYIGGNAYVAGTLTTTSNISVTGSVTATGGFFDTSDSRLKIVIKDYNNAKGIENVEARLYLKNNKKELGYFAQDIEEILPSAVSKGEDGYLTLSYSQVHTAKIAYLEEKVAQLEELIKSLL